MNFFSNIFFSKPVETLTRYEELVAIKDRLHKDMARLDELLGTEVAARNIDQIRMTLGV